MRLTLCLTIFLVQIILYAKANQGKYTVVAPNTIYANDKYTASVALHRISQPCKIKVSIDGPSYNEIKSIEVAQNEVKNFEFDVPSLKGNDDDDDLYYLTIESVNCAEVFKNTTEIFYHEMKNYVSIQTNKHLYKHGDDIKFRVLFLDKDSKPVEPTNDAVIWFKDGKHKTVREIKELKANKGVYTGQFRIPEFTVAGLWTLGVKDSGRFDHKEYFVVDNIRAKYIVKVDATDSISVKDGDIQVVVSANHISGKPLDGKVTINLSAIGNPRIIIKTNMVNGKTEVDVNVKDELLPFITDSTELSITATIVEKLTGEKISATTSTFIYPYRYTLICTRSSSDSCFSFEGGKENDMHFQIIHFNGTYVKDTKSPVEFTYQEVLRKNMHYPGVVSANIQPISENHIVTSTGFMNETGFVNLKVSLPELAEYEGYLHFYKLAFKYLDEHRDILYTYQSSEDKNSKKYFMLVDQASNNKLRLSTAHQFTLNSSQPLSYIVYNIVGRRNIVKSDRVDLPHKPKVYNLSLTPELSWTPKFHLYIYYVDENGEYHYAEQTYHINEQPNPITITAAEHVKPGEEMAFKIQTTPNSFVGLMAVEQRVLLLEKTNDLSPSQVDKFLDDYSSFTPPPGGYSLFPGKSSGCVTLTNANYNYNWKGLSRPNLGLDKNGGIYRKNPVKETVAVTPSSKASTGIGVVGSSDGTSDANNEAFLETWIFDDIVNTEFAKFTWTKKVPETYNSTWVLTAFSFNPSKGLGVTEQLIKITTIEPLG